MILLTLLEALFYFILIWGAITQLMIPAIKNQPFFPWFWSAETRLQVKIARAEQLAKEHKLEELWQAQEDAAHAREHEAEAIEAQHTDAPEGQEKSK